MAQESGGHDRNPSHAELARDLERCRESERAHAEGERGYRRFLENLSDGYFFYRHDRDRVYQYLSPSITDLLGYTPEEYVAAYSLLFTAGAVNEEAAARTARALAGDKQRTFEAEMRAKDGSLHHFEITEYPVVGAAGTVELIEGIAHDVTEQKKMAARLLELATHDELTGLLNRRHLQVRLEEAVCLARRHEYVLSMALIDLDGLKRINDTYGHAAGDQAICGAARILQHEVRRGDIVGRIEGVTGRLGGDEFAAILPYASAAQAKVALARILSALTAARIAVAPQTWIPLQASVGIADLADRLTIEELQGRADEALYRSKREGRGRITIWQPPAD